MTTAEQSAPVWGTILLAGGSGRRMGDAIPDKLLHLLAGKAVFLWSAEALLAAGPSHQLIIVHRDAGQRVRLAALAKPLMERHPDLLIRWTVGGATRADSVRAGLARLTDEVTHVLIHDGARPAVRVADVAACRRHAEADGAASLARPVTDTIKRVAEPGGWRNQALEDLDRARLRAMETPQAFQRSILAEGYRLAQATGQALTDDTAACTLARARVTLVTPEAPNPKLTRIEDVPRLEHLLANPEHSPATRHD